MALSGNTVAEKIWNFCIAKGLTTYGTAGLIGNIDAESALNSKNLQDTYQAKLGYSDDTYVAAIDNGIYAKEKFIFDEAGFGICQWTYYTRKKALYEYAKKASRSIGDLEMQLEFLFYELQNSFPRVLNVLKVATSVSQASDIVLMEFECPYNAAAQKTRRSSFGQKYYTQFVTNSGSEYVTINGYITVPKGCQVQLTRNFTSMEFDCHGEGCCEQTVINEELPKLLQKIRDHFDKPITITSGYRCPIHNSRVGGAVGSRHSKGDAADIVVKDTSPREVAKYAESIGILGVGLYETDSDGHFVHIDTRNYKSFWYGQSEKPMTTFGGASAAVLPSISNPQVTNTIIDFGDQGEAVRDLQKMLIKLGFSCGKGGADGIFGDDTLDAVKKFQKAARVTVDGIVGYQTYKAIEIAAESISEAPVNKNQVIVNAKLVNVRAGAGLNYTVLTTVRMGQVCDIVEERDGWIKISKPLGWVSKDYVSKV